jgi:adenosylcobyric acid synthase
MSDSNNRAYMLLGTASNVGKSLMTVALCRWLHRHGKAVVPFKALNVALNSYPAAEGGEIGMAQAQQAMAAGLSPSVDMNPVLIKLGGNGHSQLILRGKVSQDYESTLPASSHSAIQEVILRSYHELRRRYEIVILEGSGSPVEMNLKDRDLANLWMAEAADAKCVLVADIERGGVFASMIGTWTLLSSSERSRFVGFIINKFYGDADAFSDGARFIEEQTGLRCLGVIPYLPNLHLKDEDSLDLEPFRRRGQAVSAPDSLRIGVIRYPHISNFTDFDALAQEPSVELIYCQHPTDCEEVDLIILPGTKSTVADLTWLRSQHLTEAISRLQSRGVRVFGICGGMQMLGQRIEDPSGVEMDGGDSVDGLGLLPIRTVMATTKVTVPVRARMFDSSFCSSMLEGYEIHMGRSEPTEDRVAPLLEVWGGNAADSQPDGAQSPDGRVWGTYMHGLFDNDDFRLSLLNLLRREKGIIDLQAVQLYSEGGYFAELDRWTDHVIEHLDPDFLRVLLSDRPDTQHLLSENTECNSILR